MKLFAGIDPDMHCLPYVVLEDREDGSKPTIADIQLLRVSDKSKGQQAVTIMAHQLMFGLKAREVVASAVEAQEIYRNKTPNPKSILLLGNVAGAAIAAMSVVGQVVYFPEPKEWKKQVPKAIHQGRSYTKMGIEYARIGKEDGYCLPAESWRSMFFPHVKKADWKHVGDAIGLALYARERYYAENKKR
jgi:Holliday junction resolvasome RuvABC endonuclease subunit